VTLRRRAIAAIALSAILVGCSSSGSGDRAKPGPKGNSGGAERVAWKASVDDPCKLLPLAEVKRLLPKGGVEAGGSGPRSCAYTAKAGRTIGVDLYFPQTSRSFASRTTGVPKVGGQLRPVLVSVGSAVLVRNGNALAMVWVRSTAGGDKDGPKDAAALAKVVAARLSPAPAPPKGIVGRDPCDVVPVTTFPKGTMTYDVGSALSCGYVLGDNTTVSVQIAAGSAGRVGDPWPGGGTGALWQQTGQTGRGLVPVGDATAIIDFTSPGRDEAALMKLGAEVAAKVRVAAGQ
jgi:hypothetical protein